MAAMSWASPEYWRGIRGTSSDAGADAFVEETQIQSYFDLTGNYVINENITARLGVNNILDKEKVITGNTVDVGAFYDNLGRFVNASVTLTF